MRLFDKYIIPQPDLLFYFTADSKVLYERKHEIGLDEISKQKILYTSEIERSNAIVKIETDGPIEDSVQEVLLECFQYMGKRYL